MTGCAHALAAVDQERERGRLILLASEIECLRDPVFADLKIGAGQGAHEFARFVLNRRVHENARDLRQFRDLECFQRDRIGGGVAEAVGGFNLDFIRIEGVDVVPIGCKRRVRDRRKQRPVDPELHRLQRDARHGPDLSDDSDGPRLAGASHRRCDAHGQRGRGIGCGGLGHDGHHQQHDSENRRECQSPVSHKPD